MAVIRQLPQAISRDCDVQAASLLRADQPSMGISDGQRPERASSVGTLPAKPRENWFRKHVEFIFSRLFPERCVTGIRLCGSESINVYKTGGKG